MITAITFGVAGLLTGWIFLPEPKFVRDFFVRLGVAKPDLKLPRRAR